MARDTSHQASIVLSFSAPALRMAVVNSSMSIRVPAGRKHQLRKACARVLQAPIIGDGLYGQTRSAQQLWFNDRLDQQPCQPDDRAEEALSRMLRCNRYLQLHCVQVAHVNLPDALPPR